MKALLEKVNWDVVWSTGRSLLLAGGPVATLLVALGFPPVQVGAWMGAGLAAIAVASVLVPGIIGALSHTEAATTLKAADVPGVKVTVDAQAAPNKVLQVALDPTNSVKVEP